MDKIEKDYLEEAGRTVRKEFVQDIARVVERGSSPAFPPQEQAQILRQMADQLEKGQQQEKLLAGTKVRLEQRHPPTAFFTHVGNPERYWEGKGKAPVPRKDWAAVAQQDKPRETKPLPVREEKRDYNPER